MKKLIMLAGIMAMILGFSMQAHAALNLLGQGTSVHGTYNLIYDTDFDITWYDFSNSPTNWANQVAWASGLTVTFGSNTYDDWRLPTTTQPDSSCSSHYTPGDSFPLQGAGLNCTGSEMGHLYNVDGVTTSTPGDFQNLVAHLYWSGTEYAPTTGAAWLFNRNDGRQDRNTKGYGFYAVAVRPGLAVVSEPISCVGFEPPLASGPVTLKKNRVLPLKAQLLDGAGNIVTDSDIAALPVLQVLYDSGIRGDPVDVTNDALPAGQGTEGNQFVFTDDLKWQFNLKTRNYTAVGTYNITMVSGDDSEYMIEPMCEAGFVIE